MGLIDDQFSVLLEAYTDADMQHLSDGSHVVTVPNVQLPSGWSTPNTTIKFLAPPVYPHGRPDCFWTDQALRLLNGALPQNTNVQPIPGTGTSDTWLWFSWHSTHWNPNRDTLTTYMNIIRDRFKKVQ